MANVKSKRNGYIDIIKFLFAIIIADFHLNSGLFLGGRLAVEGFFMITGFLMMKSVASSSDTENLGKATVRFMFRKYKALLPVLFVSAILGFIVYSIVLDFTLLDSIKMLPLLIFDIFPLNTAGFKGFYVVGISWYLSSMFIALAILYPLAKRFKSNFSLIACPLISFLCYGLLCAKYGHIAVGTTYIPNTVIQTGIIRALAGCSLGCLIYEINKRIATKEYTKFAKIVFTVCEPLLLLFIFCMMHFFAKTGRDYVTVFAIFAMLIIGISGLSYTSKLWNPKWTKHFGTASTLIVLNHYCWIRLLETKFTQLEKGEFILLFIAFTAIACVFVHFASKLLCILTGKLLKKERWIKSEPQGEQN